MKSFHKIILLLIILLSFFLRFYQLGQNPPSLDWDEASIGYNAYSVLKTGADEYGTKLPLAFRSFGDYKPPLYIYLTVPSVAVFGLNEFAVRFPSALFGVLTVVVAYFLIKELFPKLPNYFYLLFTLFLAISPWHLQFSRVAFEANVALFFFVFGVFLFLKGLKNGYFLLFSGISFVASIYTYHSPRLVVPLLLLGFSIYFYRELWKVRKWVIISAILSLILLLPLFQLLLGSGGARFSSVTTLTPQGTLDRSVAQINYDLSKGDPLAKVIHNRRIVYFLTVVGGYLDHFDANFLFLNGDPPGRHHAINFGMLYVWDFPFVLLGIYLLLRSQERAKFPVLWWFLVAPAASAITSGTPHAVRSLLFLPTFQVFSAFGLYGLYLWIKDKLGMPKARYLLIFALSFLILNFFYYLHMYYVHTPIEASEDWQYGYKQMVWEVSKLENNYQKIYVTYKYDQPYVYFLFYQKIDPTWYQKQAPHENIERFTRSFGKFKFINIDDFQKYSKIKNVLIVGTPQEIAANTFGIIKDIKFLDNKVAFRIVGR